MKGVVSKIRKDGLIEVQAETCISVIELLGAYEVEVGDEIEGDLDNLGSEELLNLSQVENMDVYIQDLK